MLPYDFEEKGDEYMNKHYTLFKYCPRIEGIVTEGDVLFSPPN